MVQLRNLMRLLVVASTAFALGCGAGANPGDIDPTDSPPDPTDPGDPSIPWDPTDPTTTADPAAFELHNLEPREGRTFGAELVVITGTGFVDNTAVD